MTAADEFLRGLFVERCSNKLSGLNCKSVGRFESKSRQSIGNTISTAGITQLEQSVQMTLRSTLDFSCPRGLYL